HIRRLIPDRMGRAITKLNPVVAAGITHDHRVVTPHAGEWIERRRRGLVWGVLFADLDGADAGISQANVAVAAEQRAVDLIAEVPLRLSFARKRGNVDSGFELIDEPPIASGSYNWLGLDRKTSCLWPAQSLEAPNAQIGNIGRDVGHPAEIARCLTDTGARPDAEGALAVYVVEAAEKSGDGLGGGVERHVDLAIGGDLAARRFEGQRVSLLVPEEPLVLVSPRHRQVGDLGLSLRGRC